MEYECIYNPEINAIEVSTHGKADLTALSEMTHRVAALCDQERSANILVDHSELDAGNLTMDDIETLGSNAVSYKGIFSKRRVAHVVAVDYQFGLVRAWEIIVEVRGLDDIEKRVFKNRVEAIEWLTT